MSDIPLARAILEMVKGCSDLFFMKRGIGVALQLMDRERPDFVAPKKYKRLTPEQEERARELRAGGMPVDEIAKFLGTNLGRVSEAIHRKRKPNRIKHRRR